MCRHHQFSDVNQYLEYENDMQQPIFDHVFYARYTVFLNKRDATKIHTWGGKGGIISELRNEINIPDRNNS